MKKALIIILIIFVVVFGLGFLMISFLGSMMDREPMVASSSVLEITLSGEMAETVPEDLMSRMMAEPVLSFSDALNCIKKGAVDSRIKGIWLKLDLPLLGWGKVDELHQELARFKESGKFVVASAVMCREIDYACMLAADKIYLSPESYFEFNGFVAQGMFVRDMFDNLNIDPYVVRIGDFKSAGDMIDRNSMSDAQKEVMNSMLTQSVDRFIDMVHLNRGLSADQVERMLNESLYTPDQALENNLVDGILYPDEIENSLKEQCGVSGDRKLPVISAGKYRRISWEGLTDWNVTDKFAVIYAVGGIVQGQDQFNPLLGRSMGSDSFIDTIRKVRRDKSIKAVIVRIDSPGGDGIASDMMWRELRITDEEKPVIASMSDVAASGGYYLAMGCRKIVAQPGTVTGSIGVVNAFFNMKGLYDWAGIKYETVSLKDAEGNDRFIFADMMTDTRPPSTIEWERFQQQTRDFYNRFVKKAADSRGVSPDEMHKWAQGRVWTGTQALENGLIDILGGMTQAVEAAKTEAGIPLDKKVQLVVYPQPKSLFDQVMASFGNTQAWTPDPEIRHKLNYLQTLAATRSKSIQAVMPYYIEIK